MNEDDGLVEVFVDNLGISPTIPPRAIVLLKEKNGLRVTTVPINIFTLNTFSMTLENMKTSRPLTHDLLINTISVFGVIIKQVSLSRGLNEEFDSVILLKKPGGEEIKIPSRPEDAMLLAMKSCAPIFVHENVLQADLETKGNA